jgi:hypothetical protein
MYDPLKYVGRKERKKERGKGRKDGTKGRRCKKSREKMAYRKYSKRGNSTLLQNHIKVRRWVPRGFEGAL